MDRLVIAWYGWLSSLTQGVAFELQSWTERLQLPVIVALLFGLIGATAPCQLTTNLGALAYASSRAKQRTPFLLALAYVCGKVTVYTLVGALVIVAGLQLDRIAVPIVVTARKGLGPLMVIVGLALFGLIRVRLAMGQQLAFRFQNRVAGRGVLGAYALGVVFSFAFCPTLFWLFFGLTVPLALRSSGGWALPGAFALGSALPLLALTGVVSAGLGTVDRLVGGIRHVDRPMRVVAGTILVLAGLHDTIVYWLL